MSTSRKWPARRCSASHCSVRWASVARPMSTMKTGISGTTTARISADQRSTSRMRSPAASGTTAGQRQRRAGSADPRLEGVERRGGERADPRRAELGAPVGPEARQVVEHPVAHRRCGCRSARGRWPTAAIERREAAHARPLPTSTPTSGPDGAVVAVDQVGEVAADASAWTRIAPRPRSDGEARRTTTRWVRRAGDEAQDPRIERPRVGSRRRSVDAVGAVARRQAGPGTCTGGMCAVADALAEHPVRPGLVHEHHRAS